MLLCQQVQNQSGATAAAAAARVPRLPINPGMVPSPWPAKRAPERAVRDRRLRTGV